MADRRHEPAAPRPQGRLAERRFHGSGADEDIIMSSARAYVSALNKASRRAVPGRRSSQPPPACTLTCAAAVWTGRAAAPVACS